MPHISEDQWRGLLNYAKRQLVYDLLLGNLQNIRIIWERMNLIGISVMPKLALVLRFDNYFALTYDWSERNKHQFREEIWTFLEGLLPDNVLGVPYAENLIAFLIPLKSSLSEEQRLEIVNLLSSWSEKLSEQFGIKAVYGIGGVYNDPRLLHFSFQECFRVLNHPAYYGLDLRFAESIEKQESTEETLSGTTGSKDGGGEIEDSFLHWPEWARKRIIRKLELGDNHGFLQELMNAFHKQMDLFKEKSREEISLVVSLELAMALLRDVFPESHSYRVYEEFARYLSSSEPETVEKRLERFGEDLIHWFETLKANRMNENPNITYVRTYIEDHLEGELSLSHIAEVVHLAPSYLSQLFKKQTGKGLNDFVAERRLSEACRLLKTTSLPVSNIARKVGFKDVNYFTRVFKQKQQLTPLEFRKGAKQS